MTTRTRTRMLLLAAVLQALPGCAWFRETMSHGPLVPTTDQQERQADRWQYGRHPDLDPRLQQGRLADQDPLHRWNR